MAQGLPLRLQFERFECKYLLTEADARSHLGCVANALRPGGIYVLGLHLTDYDWDRLQRERWVGERGGTHVVCNIQSWPADRRTRTERVRSRITANELGRTKRLETNWRFRTYDAAQLRRTLRAVPQLQHVANHDFSYELDTEHELSDVLFDCVLVLRRR